MYFACILLILANFYYTPDMWGYQVFANTADYASPLVLIASVSIFLFFKALKFENEKINKGIRLISSTTFGIYLLQEARFFKPHLYFDILKIQRYYSRPTSVLYILAMVSVIFVVGVLFDLLRQWLFSGMEKITARYKKK
jgi:surface polysaccharide O-acyltransferase-like enzyme